MRTSFKMEEQYITMVRGDTLSFGLYIDGLGEQDLDTAFFTCKSNKSSEVNVFQKSLGSGITKYDDEKYIVRVAPEDTKDVEAGKYFYDLQIGLNDDIFTVLHGVLEITQDVTF
jgi:hypothetical protein